MNKNNISHFLHKIVPWTLRGSLRHIMMAVLFIALFSSCHTSRYLKPSDVLLKSNQFVFKEDVKGMDEKLLKDELSTIISQKPNERLLFAMPREWIYLINNEPGDTTWFHDGMKNIGQPPVLFDDEVTKKTAADMQEFLRNEKGYYEAKVDYTTVEKNKIRSQTTSFGTYISTPNAADVTYIVQPGSRYTIKSVQYVCADSSLMKIIRDKQDASFVKKGNYFDLNDFNLEKSRITLDIQNEGYFNFNANFIDIVADSNRVTKEIDFWFEIAPPANSDKHISYSIGEINVSADYYKEFDAIKPKNSIDSLGLKIKYFGDKLLVKPSVLRKSVFLTKGEKYTFTNRQKTFRKLNSLPPYRFVNITTVPRADSDTIIDVSILLTPQDDKYIVEGDLETYYSSFDVFNLLGMSLSGNIIDRNFLKGAENFSLRGQFGFGLDIERAVAGGRTFSLQSRNISLNSNLQVPTHVDFLGLSKLVNRTGLIKDRFYKNFDDEAKTNISLGFTSLEFFNFYGFNSLNAAFGYEYTSPKGHKYIFRPMGVNFDQYNFLDTNGILPIIFLQFRDVLGTGIFFRDFTHIYNGAKNRKGRSYVVINKLEFSGLEVDLVNRAYNAILNKNEDWHITLAEDKKIDFAKYIKYEFDFRYNREYSKKSSLAFRFNVGAAIPFDKNRVVPFIKQFGLGGPNSMRGWNIRQLGPGGYILPYKVEAPADLNIFIQQGDLKFETNIEFRFNLFLFLDAAVFIDAGNVWNLRENKELPDAHISSQFYNQIAVAGGYGLRLNFVFFNIRFDTGYKIRSPYRDRFLNRNWYSWKEIVDQGLGTIQVAVNFPF